MLKKIKTFLFMAMAILTIVGVVTFSMFILEESLQTIMFGTWAAQDAKNWKHVLRGADAMEYTNKWLKRITNWFGWINPFAFVSYRHYAEATDYYIESLRQKVLINAPHLLEGREVEMEFRPVQTTTTETEGLFILRSGRFHVYANHRRLTPFNVRGILTIINGKLFIDSGIKNRH